MFNFPRGQELPALYPVMETKDKKQSSEDEEEERSLTDAQQLKQDTVKVWKKRFNNNNFENFLPGKFCIACTASPA